LGLFGLYALIGLVSSILLSPDPPTAVYWAGEYVAVLIVLWAILADANPLARLSRLMNLNWTVVAAMTLGMLASIPYLGEAALVRDETNPLGVRPFSGGFTVTGEILGMPATRNTGFGRYAAVTGLVALDRLWGKGKKASKIIWLVIFLFSLFSLVFSQGRADVIAFIGGAVLILWLRQASRELLIGGGLVVALMLGLTGFYHAFWQYGTRSGTFDPTLTGRTATWRRALTLLKESPLLGLGFHADFLTGEHMHNGLFHALVQAGLFGTIPYVAAIVGTWILIFRLYGRRQPQGLPPLRIEVPAILGFFTVLSITESTFAWFGVDWFLSAPCIAYMEAAMRQRKEMEWRMSLRESPRNAFGPSPSRGPVESAVNRGPATFVAARRGRS
jgi:hypothetical protein